MFIVYIQAMHRQQAGSSLDLTRTGTSTCTGVNANAD